MRVFPLAVAAIIALAGCASSGPVDDLLDEGEELVWKSPDWAIDALANNGDHDHFELSHHEGRTTPNFREMGHDGLVTERAGGSSGGYLCGEVARDLEGRDVAVTQSHYDDVALVIADVTNASAPEVLGEVVVAGFSTYDAAISDDARFALIAVSSGSLPETYATDATGAPLPGETIPIQVGWRSACQTMLSPIVEIVPAPSVLLVDLFDPTQPVIVDQAIVPGIGVHSVMAATIDGTDYVVASSTGLAQGASSFMFYTIETLEPAGPYLRVYGMYDGSNVQSRDMGYGIINLHTDATIQKHPGTDQILAYLANWDGGMIIVELVAPGVIAWQGDWGAWMDMHTQGSPYAYAIHSTYPMPHLQDGRHFTIIGEETITPRTGMPTGLVLVIDTTDPSNPHEVARWTLPSDVGGWDESLIYSPHYVAAINETVFVTLYHAGVWAFDASPEHWPYPPTLGAYIPTTENPHAPPAQGGWVVMGAQPSIAEVVIKADGKTLVSFDSRGGVYTFEYEHDDRVEPVPSWFAQE